MPQIQTIENDAFRECSALTSIELPEVENIGAGAFDGCSALTSIELPQAILTILHLKDVPL